MPVSTLLHTATPSYLDLVGNGKRYEVPRFQRDYSWKSEHWEDLWNDILELEQGRSESHYMGALVVETRDDQTFLIIDGQQRLATLSLLTLAVIRRLHLLAEAGHDAEANKMRMALFMDRYIGEKSVTSLTIYNKLKLNRNNNSFYQDYLLRFREPANLRGLKKSERLLYDGFQYFLDKLKDYDDGEILATLLNDTIARRLLFILITVEDELNAYTVFETLNARGVELTATDLIKNFLFSKMTVEADLEVVQQRWESLTSVVQPEKFPEFLRYYLLLEASEISKTRLFKELKGRIKRSEQVIELLDSLDEYAELYSALFDPEHDYWIDIPEAKASIKELKLFSVTQMTPVVFAAWSRFRDEPKNFVKILKLLSILSFRFSAIASGNPNIPESLYPKVARLILSGKLNSPRQIFGELLKLYGTDESFKKAFESRVFNTKNGTTKKLAKYILSTLEQKLSGKSYALDTLTIEHILPETLSPNWLSEFPENRHALMVYSIGNLTLLEKHLNHQAGSKSFSDKQAIYEISEYALTRELAGHQAPVEWTPESLQRRQVVLAELASQIWRLDYDEVTN